MDYGMKESDIQYAESELNGLGDFWKSVFAWWEVLSEVEQVEPAFIGLRVTTMKVMI